MQYNSLGFEPRQDPDLTYHKLFFNQNITRIYLHQYCVSCRLIDDNTIVLQQRQGKM